MAKIEIEKSRFSRLTDEQHSSIVDAIRYLADLAAELRTGRKYQAETWIENHSTDLYESKEEIIRDLEGLENFAFIDPEESEIYREAIEKAAQKLQRSFPEETEGEG